MSEEQKATGFFVVVNCHDLLALGPCHCSDDWAGANMSSKNALIRHRSIPRGPRDLIGRLIHLWLWETQVSAFQVASPLQNPHDRHLSSGGLSECVLVYLGNQSLWWGGWGGGGGGG